MEQLIKDEINKEMILNAEIQRQCLKSLPRKFKVRKVVNPTTQKMIDDFKQQFNKKKGDKAYLFPELRPLLIDEHELSKIDQPLSENRVISLTEDIQNNVAEYTQLETDTIPRYRKRLEELKLERNTTITQLDNKKKNKNNLRNKKQQIEDDIVKLEADILQDTNRMSDLQREIDRLKKIITDNNETSDNYSNLRASIVSKNQTIVRDYENNIRILNEGQINMGQQPDESEDDYMRRLDAMTNEEYDDTELEEKAYLANINEFKTNMKTLISSEWKIENIMNELGRDKVFILNKTFPGFEKEFLKIYGKNNTNVSPEDFLILIDRYIDGNDTPLEKVKEAGVVVEPFEVEASSVKPSKFTRVEDEDNGITFELIEKDTTLIVKNIKNNIEVFLSLGERETGLRRVMYRYDFSDVGKPLKRQTKTESFPSNFKKVFLDYLEMTK